MCTSCLAPGLQPPVNLSMYIFRFVKMKRKHGSILSYYTPSSVGSTETEPEHVAMNDSLPFHTAPQPEHEATETEHQTQSEHKEAEPEHEAETQPQHEPDPQILQSNATTYDGINLKLNRYMSVY